MSGLTVAWSSTFPHRCGTPVRDGRLEEDLEALYSPPTSSWVRANMISTVDGSATGVQGLSGEIGTDADKRVFTRVLRPWADAVVVGAGTVRDEGYAPSRVGEEFADLRTRRGQQPHPYLVVVTSSGDVPENVAKDEYTIIAQNPESPKQLLADLAERGLRNVLVEGGPSLLTAWADHIDEWCITTSGTLVGGDGPRILGGDGVSCAVEPQLILLNSDTVLTRWVATR